MTIYSNRKLVCGIGVNDADYDVKPRVNGKQIICPFYARWKSMLERCYSKKVQERQPTYRGCSVSKDWLRFSNFKSWMKNQDWDEKALDKDLLYQGNTVYSADTCLFIPQDINNLFLTNKNARGKYPVGVSQYIGTKKFQAHCKTDGKLVYLGIFGTVEEAHEAYKKFKYTLVREIAEQQPEPLRSALLAYEIEKY